MSREERKEGRRSKQLAAEAARDRAEDEYFKQCQSAALKSGEAKKVAAGLSGQEADAHEKALFWVSRLLWSPKSKSSKLPRSPEQV